jgi:hypothetical protein
MIEDLFADNRFLYSHSFSALGRQPSLTQKNIPSIRILPNAGTRALRRPRPTNSHQQIFFLEACRICTTRILHRKDSSETQGPPADDGSSVWTPRLRDTSHINTSCVSRLPDNQTCLGGLHACQAPHLPTIRQL